MDFSGGPKEAAKMLQGLGKKRMTEVLEEIRSRDPQMAKLIEDSMISTVLFVTVLSSAFVKPQAE